MIFTDLASTIAFSGPGLILALTYAAMLSGSVLAYLAPRSAAEPGIGRARLLFLLLAVSAVSTINTAAWTAAKLQIGSSMSPLNALTWLVCLMAMGWTTMRAARGRRVDIGLPPKADLVFAIFPFLAIVLAAFPPRLKQAVRNEVWIMRGRRAIYSGLLLLALSFPASIQMVKGAAGSDVIGTEQARNAVAARVRYDGIEGMLEAFAAGLRDNGGVASAEGSQLLIRAEPEAGTVTPEWRAAQIPVVCQDPVFAAMIAEGARIVFELSATEETLVVTQSGCGPHMD